ncbi:MAG: CPBP family intramembrane metalloprotease [Proteobacteria bacterium]|nr:CPBP family intramembrane metalloprotease [Pseudomonadota bacterium]
MRCKTFILQEKFFLFAVSAFVFFWLRAVNCEINLYNIGKLIVGLLINIPLFFIGSSNLRKLLRKIFGGNHKYIKLCTYIIVIKLIYSAFIAEHIYSYHSYFTILLALTTFHIWQQVFLLFFGYLLINKFNESELTIKVIIFIIGSFIFGKISYVLFPKYFSLARYHIYDFSLFRVYFYNKFGTFDLYEFWWLCLPVLIIVLSDISFSHIDFDKKWNKKSILLTSFFLCYMILPYALNVDLKYQQLEMQRVLWSLLSSIYSAIEVPFFEEILFRGVIQTYFCTKLSSIKDGNIIAIIITSLLFGLLHYSFINTSFSPHFIHGFVFGWLYYKTKNIWSPILVHSFNNFLFYQF